MASTAMPTPSREQLQLAYRHYADHHWPATLEEALRRPAYAKIIHALAVRMNRARWHGATHTGHSLPRPPVPATPQVPSEGKHQRSPYSLVTGPQSALSVWTKKLPNTGGIDRKRLAANDKDD